MVCILHGYNDVHPKMRFSLTPPPPKSIFSSNVTLPTYRRSSPLRQQQQQQQQQNPLRHHYKNLNNIHKSKIISFDKNNKNSNNNNNNCEYNYNNTIIPLKSSVYINTTKTMQKPGDNTNANASNIAASSNEEAVSDYKQWLHAMKLVARLPGGIPPEFRRKLWLSLADKYLKAKNVDWTKEEEKCFCDKWGEDDEELGIQIVKDLHRTGSTLCTGPAGDVNQAKLKKILLGYARYNPEVGYCQGFNMLGALILQVMDKEESESIKVMIYLVEGILPPGYFCGSMGGLQADMAVFRELMQTKLPRLAKHLQKLQGPIENAYEPPLTNVFTMQWFLTMFCTCLPMSCVLRVWDLVLIEGSDVLLRTALVLWGLLEERVLNARSADDFYGKMGSFSSELLNGHLIDSNGLIERVVKLGPITDIQKLRDKHLYNITPLKHKPGLNFYYDDDEPDIDEDSRLAVATVWGIPWGRRGSQGQTSKQASESKDRIALDISLLKKQYDRLRERQKQAHIILTTACSTARQSSVSGASGSVVPVNQLLSGRSAIVINKGRRSGPPLGAIPPARKPSLPAVLSIRPPEKQLRRGETIQWKDGSDSALGGRRDSLTWKEIKAERAALKSSGSIEGLQSQKIRTKRLGKSDSSSYSEESDEDDAGDVVRGGGGGSSTDTSLCDEEEQLSTGDRTHSSSIENSPRRRNKLGKKSKESRQKHLSDTLSKENSLERKRPKSWAPSNSEIPFVLMTTDSPNQSADEHPPEIDYASTYTQMLAEEAADSETDGDQVPTKGSIEMKWTDTKYSPLAGDLALSKVEAIEIDKEQPTSTAKQLSPTPDIAAYLGSSIIAPLPTRKPLFMESTNSLGSGDGEGEGDEGKKFDVSDEGVTNQYFERVNSAERPTKLDLLYSLNEEDSIRDAYKNTEAKTTVSNEQSPAKSKDSHATEDDETSYQKKPRTSIDLLDDYSDKSSAAFIAEAKTEFSNSLQTDKINEAKQPARGMSSIVSGIMAVSAMSSKSLPTEEIDEPKQPVHGMSSIVSGIMAASALSSKSLPTEEIKEPKQPVHGMSGIVSGIMAASALSSKSSATEEINEPKPPVHGMSGIVSGIMAASALSSKSLPTEEIKEPKPPVHGMSGIVSGIMAASALSSKSLPTEEIKEPKPPVHGMSSIVSGIMAASALSSKSSVTEEINEPKPPVHGMSSIVSGIMAASALSSKSLPTEEIKEPKPPVHGMSGIVSGIMAASALSSKSLPTEEIKEPKPPVHGMSGIVSGIMAASALSSKSLPTEEIKEPKPPVHGMSGIVSGIMAASALSSKSLPTEEIIEPKQPAQGMSSIVSGIMAASALSSKSLPTEEINEPKQPAQGMSSIVSGIMAASAFSSKSLPTEEIDEPKQPVQGMSSIVSGIMAASAFSSKSLPTEEIDEPKQPAQGMSSIVSGIMSASAMSSASRKRRDPRRKTLTRSTTMEIEERYQALEKRLSMEESQKAKSESQKEAEETSSEVLNIYEEDTKIADDATHDRKSSLVAEKPLRHIPSTADLEERFRNMEKQLSMDKSDSKFKMGETRASSNASKESINISKDSSPSETPKKEERKDRSQDQDDEIAGTSAKDSRTKLTPSETKQVAKDQEKSHADDSTKDQAKKEDKQKDSALTEKSPKESPSTSKKEPPDTEIKKEKKQEIEEKEVRKQRETDEQNEKEDGKKTTKEEERAASTEKQTRKSEEDDEKKTPKEERKDQKDISEDKPKQIRRIPTTSELEDRFNALERKMSKTSSIEADDERLTTLKDKRKASGSSELPTPERKPSISAEKERRISKTITTEEDIVSVKKHQEVTSTKKGSSPTQIDTSEKLKEHISPTEDSPKRKHSSPQQKTSSPAQKEVSPEKKEPTAASHKDISPKTKKDDSSPIKNEELSPEKKEHPTAQKDSSPKKTENTSTRKDASPEKSKDISKREKSDSDKEKMDSAYKKDSEDSSATKEKEVDKVETSEKLKTKKSPPSTAELEKRFAAYEKRMSLTRNEDMDTAEEESNKKVKEKHEEASEKEVTDSTEESKSRKQSLKSSETSEREPKRRPSEPPSTEDLEKRYETLKRKMSSQKPEAKPPTKTSTNPKQDEDKENNKAQPADREKTATPTGKKQSPPSIQNLEERYEALQNQSRKSETQTPLEDKTPDSFKDSKEVEKTKASTPISPVKTVKKTESRKTSVAMEDEKPSTSQSSRGIRPETESSANRDTASNIPDAPPMPEESPGKTIPKETRMALIEELQTKMQANPNDENIKPSSINPNRKVKQPADGTLETHATTASWRSRNFEPGITSSRKMVRRFSDLPSRADLENRLQFLEQQLSQTFRKPRRASDSEVTSKVHRQESPSTSHAQQQQANDLESRVQQLEKQLSESSLKLLEAKRKKFTKKSTDELETPLSPRRLSTDTIDATGKELVRYTHFGEVDDYGVQHPINISINIKMSLNDDVLSSKKKKSDDIPTTEQLDRRLLILEEKLKDSSPKTATASMNTDQVAFNEEPCTSKHATENVVTSPCDEILFTEEQTIGQDEIKIEESIEATPQETKLAEEFTTEKKEDEKVADSESASNQEQKRESKVYLETEEKYETEVREDQSKEDTKKDSAANKQDSKDIASSNKETATKPLAASSSKDESSHSSKTPEINEKKEETEMKSEKDMEKKADITETKQQAEVINIPQELISVANGNTVDKNALVLLLNNEPKAVKVRRLTRANTEELEGLFQALEKQLSTRNLVKSEDGTLKHADPQTKMNEEEKPPEKKKEIYDLTKEIEEFTKAEKDKANTKKAKDVEKKEEFVSTWGADPVKHHLKKATVYLPSTRELEARFRSLERQIKLLEDVENIDVEKRLVEIERKIKLQHSLSQEKDLNKFLDLCEGKGLDDEDVCQTPVQKEKQATSRHQSPARSAQKSRTQSPARSNRQSPARSNRQSPARVKAPPPDPPPPETREGKAAAKETEYQYRAMELRRSRSRQRLEKKKESKREPIHPLEMLLDPSPDDSLIPTTGELEHRIRVLHGEIYTPSPPASLKSESRSPPSSRDPVAERRILPVYETPTSPECKLPTAEQLEARLAALEKDHKFDFIMQKNYREFNQKLKDAITPSLSFEEFKAARSREKSRETSPKYRSASPARSTTSRHAEEPSITPAVSTGNLRSTSPKVIRFQDEEEDVEDEPAHQHYHQRPERSKSPHASDRTTLADSTASIPGSIASSVAHEGPAARGTRIIRETSPLRRRGTHTGTPLRTAGENINDRITSIKNTIKSIDSLCEEKPYKSEKCQRYIDSLFADSTHFADSRGYSRSRSREYAPSIRVSDHSQAFIRSMGSAESIRSISPLRATSPPHYRSNRDLRREVSPRRRRDEEREEYESRVRRDNILPINYRYNHSSLSHSSHKYHTLDRHLKSDNFINDFINDYKYEERLGSRSVSPYGSRETMNAIHSHRRNEYKSTHANTYDTAITATTTTKTITNATATASSALASTTADPLRTSDQPIEVNRPVSPYRQIGISSDLLKRSNTPVYAPTKLDIRHTTVTSTFYDRVLTEKQIEKQQLSAQPAKSPIVSPKTERPTSIPLAEPHLSTEMMIAPPVNATATTSAAAAATTISTNVSAGNYISNQPTNQTMLPPSAAPSTTQPADINLASSSDVGGVVEAPAAVSNGALVLGSAISSHQIIASAGLQTTVSSSIANIDSNQQSAISSHENIASAGFQTAVSSSIANIDPNLNAATTMSQLTQQPSSLPISSASMPEPMVSNGLNTTLTTVHTQASVSVIPPLQTVSSAAMPTPSVVSTVETSQAIITQPATTLGMIVESAVSNGVSITATTTTASQAPSLPIIPPSQPVSTIEMPIQPVVSNGITVISQAPLVPETMQPTTMAVTMPAPIAQPMTDNGVPAPMQPARILPQAVATPTQVVAGTPINGSRMPTAHLPQAPHIAARRLPTPPAVANMGVPPQQMQPMMASTQSPLARPPNLIGATTMPPQPIPGAARLPAATQPVQSPQQPQVVRPPIAAPHAQAPFSYLGGARLPTSQQTQPAQPPQPVDNTRTTAPTQAPFSYLGGGARLPTSQNVSGPPEVRQMQPPQPVPAGSQQPAAAAPAQQQQKAGGFLSSLTQLAQPGSQASEQAAAAPVQQQQQQQPKSGGFLSSLTQLAQPGAQAPEPTPAAPQQQQQSGGGGFFSSLTQLAQPGSQATESAPPAAQPQQSGGGGFLSSLTQLAQPASQPAEPASASAQQPAPAAAQQQTGGGGFFSSLTQLAQPGAQAAESAPAAAAQQQPSGGGGLFSSLTQQAATATGGGGGGFFSAFNKPAQSAQPAQAAPAAAPQQSGGGLFSSFKGFGRK